MANFLDKAGVTLLWGKVKGLIKSGVEDKLGVANGIATLGSDSKLTASQLPSLKTVNGQSIVGDGNIAIDLTIYKIVESLPEVTQAEPEKIYLVLTSGGGETGDLYSEYAVVNGKWEKFGTYKAEVDLDGYLKTENLDTEVGKLNYVKNTDYAGPTKGGVIKTGYATDAAGKNYKVEVDGNGNAFVNVPWVNTEYKDVSASEHGLMTVALFNKLNGIAENATADAAIPTTELEQIFV